MSRRFTGVALIFVSAILYAARFISAAIFGSSISNKWSADLFSAMLHYIGSGLSNWSIVALVAGIGYLIWAEVEVWRFGNKDDGNAKNTSLKINIDEVNYVIHTETDRNAN